MESSVEPFEQEQIDTYTSNFCRSPFNKFEGRIDNYKTSFVDFPQVKDFYQEQFWFFLLWCG